MTLYIWVISLTLIVVFFATIYLLLRFLEEERALHRSQVDQLLERIQRPEQRPVTTEPSLPVTVEEPDFSHLVGTISDREMTP